MQRLNDPAERRHLRVGAGLAERAAVVGDHRAKSRNLGEDRLPGVEIGAAAGFQHNERLTGLALIGSSCPNPRLHAFHRHNTWWRERALCARGG